MKKYKTKSFTERTKEQRAWKHKPVSEMSDEEMAKVLDAFFKTNFEKEIKEIKKKKKST